jgi:hypothetical protein
MGFTKFASFEVGEILDLKGSRERVTTASLSKLADFEEFRTEDGYLYARIRAISSRVNKNHDGWPAVELAGSSELFERHQSSTGGFTVEADASASYGYSTFLGKPIFVDHHNSDPDRARGVIVDAKLHVEDHRTAAELDPYYASAPDNHCPPTWVELLLEVDANSFPRLAKAIVEGSKDPSKGIDGFSMGCDVERSVCNICKNSATSPDQFCDHIRMKGAYHNYTDPETKQRISKKSYEDCYGIKFFEISAVFDPADETALVREVRAGIQEEGGPFLDPQVDQIQQHARVIMADNPGMPLEEAMQFAQSELENRFNIHPDQVDGGDGYSVQPPKRTEYKTDLPPNFPALGLGDNPRRQGSAKTADNPVPQADLTKAPSNIDTLREEKVCPVCGSMIEDEACDICGHIEPPEGFNNPDLDKAQELQLQRDQGNEQGALEAQQSAPPPMPTPPVNPQAPPVNQPALSSVTSDMRWKVLAHPHIAGRINPVERPVSPGNGEQTDEPVETILKDEVTPVTSNVRTASELIAEAGRNKENNMEKVAESVETVSAPDKRTDVTGVGGIIEASPEEASKADAQVDVTDTGGTGVEDVSADGHASIEQTSDNAGFSGGKNIEGTPTDTWSGTDGNGVTKQQDPVGSETFPEKDEGVKKSHDSGAFPEEDGGISDGGTVKGVKPIAENFGDRVDLKEPLTSPANNSGPTTTWSGTDGNGVLKQQEPVTKEQFAPFTGSVVNILKLAELEIEIGLLPAEKKFARIAELEKQAEAIVAAELRYATRVKTAGLSKETAPSIKTAKRLPVLGLRNQEAVTVSGDELKGTLFGI